MAIIDSLLKLVTARGADALVLKSDEVPFLLEGSTKRPLTMPALGRDVVAMILTEISGSEGGYAEQYTCGDDAFEVAVREAGDGHRLTFRLRVPTASHSATATPPKDDRTPVATSPRPASTPYRASGGLVDLLERAARGRASDVFLSTDGPPRARIGGALQSLDAAPVREEAIMELLTPAMSDGDHAAFEANGSADIGLTTAAGRYRVNLFKQDRGLAAVLRPIGSEVPKLVDLGLPPTFHELTAHRHGLVLMVGTAGSGKSTTLVSLVEHLNRNCDKHVVTIEDPIEYVYRPQRCLIHQREVGRHVRSFSDGLRAALRESPDVILLGEMRDRETIAAALTAAETGHLVLSTLHAASAAMAIDRIVDVFSEHQQTQIRYQLANVLRAVVTQILLPSSQPRGRVPAFERVNVTAAVSTKIRENRTHHIESEIQRGRAEGMVPLEVSLARLVRQRLITAEVARSTAQDPVLLDQLVRGAA